MSDKVVPSDKVACAGCGKLVVPGLVVVVSKPTEDEELHIDIRWKDVPGVKPDRVEWWMVPAIQKAEEVLEAARKDLFGKIITQFVAQGAEQAAAVAEAKLKYGGLVGKGDA